MSDMVCCPLSPADETAQVYNATRPIARKAHRCEECHETIRPGAKYELIKMLFDGSWSTSRICLSCVEIGDHFSCGQGRVLGELWPDLEENFYPDMKAGGPCMAGLSPEAKARLFERRLKWMEDSR